MIILGLYYFASIHQIDGQSVKHLLSIFLTAGVTYLDLLSIPPLPKMFGFFCTLFLFSEYKFIIMNNAIICMIKSSSKEFDKIYQ